MTTLYERLGGEAAIDKAVDLFYQRMLADERVNKFFQSTNMERQRTKQKAFLTMVFGGPNNYTGLDMRQGHKGMVANGLNDTHVDVTIGHLGAVLQELGAAEADIAEVAAIASSVRNDVLNR